MASAGVIGIRATPFGQLGIGVAIANVCEATIVTRDIDKMSWREHDALNRRSATGEDVQMPSLALSRSFTACGLALPPDDFIT